MLIACKPLDLEWCGWVWRGVTSLMPTPQPGHVSVDRRPDDMHQAPPTLRTQH